MTMSIEEKFNKDAQWLLDELQADLIVSTNDKIRYLFIKDEKTPNEREQRRIIHWLIGIGAVQHIGDINEESPSFLAFNPFIKTAVIGFRLQIDRTIFNTLRKIYDGDLSNMPAKELLEQAETLGRAKRLETQKLTEPEKIVIKPLLDEPSKTVILAGKKSTIPVGNQWVLCKQLFKKPAGDWVMENDVIHFFNKDGKQSFYDAQRLLNARIEDDLGIRDFIEYKTAMARINPKTIEKLNHSEK